MFDEVAAKYDRTNDVLSLGQDRRWRRAVVEALDVRAGRAPARPGRRDRDVDRAVRRRRRARGGLRLLPRHAPGRAPRASGPRLRRGGRDAAAVRGPRLRRGDDLVRAAERRRRGRRPGRAAARHAGRWPHGGLRVLAPDLDAVPDGLHGISHAGAARGRPAGVVVAGLLRLPRGVDPRVARPARPRASASRRPAGPRWSTATSPEGSSPCTAPSAAEQPGAERAPRPTQDSRLPGAREILHKRTWRGRTTCGFRRPDGVRQGSAHAPRTPPGAILPAP